MYCSQARSWYAKPGAANNKSPWKMMLKCKIFPVGGVYKVDRLDYTALVRMKPLQRNVDEKRKNIYVRSV